MKQAKQEQKQGYYDPNKCDHGHKMCSLTRVQADPDTELSMCCDARVKYLDGGDGEWYLTCKCCYAECYWA